MKACITYTDNQVQEKQIKDAAMSPGAIILKLDDENDLVIPYNNVFCIQINKETPCIVTPLRSA